MIIPATGEPMTKSEQVLTEWWILAERGFYKWPDVALFCHGAAHLCPAHDIELFIAAFDMAVYRGLERTVH